MVLTTTRMMIIINHVLSPPAILVVVVVVKRVAIAMAIAIMMDVSYETHCIVVIIRL